MKFTEQASVNKQLADDFVGEVVKSVTTGKGVVTPKTDKKLSRPSDLEMIQVVAEHYKVSIEVAASWLSEIRVAA